jgi:hypothetical protein
VRLQEPRDPVGGLKGGAEELERSLNVRNHDDLHPPGNFDRQYEPRSRYSSRRFPD